MTVDSYQNLNDMKKMVFISLPIDDLQTVIIDCVNFCLTSKKQEQTPTEPAEKWLDLNDLVQYDPEKRSKPTWYSKISRNEVPHYKRGKKLYFLKSEIDEWLKQGKCKSNAEIEQEAQVYLLNNKKGLSNG
jgi:predicted DNA-binding transcriptional regulator AlpA